MAGSERESWFYCVWNVEECVERGLKMALVEARGEERQQKRCKEKETGEPRTGRGREGLFCELAGWGVAGRACSGSVERD